MRCQVAPAQPGAMGTLWGLSAMVDIVSESVAERLIHAVLMQAKRGKIAIAGKDKRSARMG